MEYHEIWLVELHRPVIRTVSSHAHRLQLSWRPLVELLCPYNGPVQYSYIMDPLDTPMSMDLRRKIFYGHPNSCLYRKWTSFCATCTKMFQ